MRRYANARNQTCVGGPRLPKPRRFATERKRGGDGTSIWPTALGKNAGSDQLGASETVWASVQYEQSASSPDGSPGVSPRPAISPVPNHFKPWAVHNGPRASASCAERIAVRRLTDGIDTINSTASKASRTMGRKRVGERITREFYAIRP